MTALPKPAWIVLAFGALAVQAHAADLLPPSWRGAPGTTQARWDFTAGDEIAPPDAFSNGHGMPWATVSVESVLGTGWWHQLSGFGTQTGYWDLGGSGGQIAITIPEPELAAGHRELAIQVTSFRDISQPPAVQISGGTMTDYLFTVVEFVDTGGEWVLDRYDLKLDSAPAHDLILIVSHPDLGSVVDAVVIDTRTFVTPAFCARPSVDIDEDQDVDAGDLAVFEACAAGPALPWPVETPECACFDVDGDGDVDQDDFGAFQRCFSGEGNAADVDCLTG